MGLLGMIKSLFGGQTNLQGGKQNQSAQTGDNSPVNQTQLGDDACLWVR